MQTATVPLLEIRKVESWFETPKGMLRAVDGISLTVSAGQALGIVGESGSGKTQTFFSVFGLSHGWPGIVRGSARIGDLEILDGLSDHTEFLPADGASEERVAKDAQRWDALHHKRLATVMGSQVAMMFQDAKRSLVPYWTVRQHLAHILKRQNSENLEERSRDLLLRFRLHQTQRILDSYAAALSGGEAQRVMLALVMAMQPRLLIADEPTTALDAVSQMRVLEELQQIHRESDVALVVISHDLAVVGRIVEHVVVFFGGHVVERAPVSVLTGVAEDSLHPYSMELRESQRRRSAGLPIAGAKREQVGAQRSTGCPYAERCTLRPRLGPQVQEQCRTKFPEETRIADDHSVACWGLAS